MTIGYIGTCTIIAITVTNNVGDIRSTLDREMGIDILSYKTAFTTTCTPTEPDDLSAMF